MNRYGYRAGIVALTLAISVLPVSAFAEHGVEAGGDVQVEANGVSLDATGTAQVNDENSNTDVQSSNEDQSEAGKQSAERDREAAKNAFEAMKESLPFSLDASTTAALSLSDLHKSIELRKEALDQEEEDASTTPDVAEAVKDANPVRLAVHTLLASKALLGGIGPEVSDIAQQMNDTLATTTNAELKIQSRGFLTRLLFGGDRRSAESISQAVAQNEQRIETLTALMSNAAVPADLKTTIQAQIDALQSAQAHLTALADIEAKSWGLFSWRF